MKWVFRTMIVPDQIVATVRQLADSFGPAAANMFTTPLSPTGELPATHYISTGQIGDDFAAIMPFSHFEDVASVNLQGYIEHNMVWVTEPYSAAAFVSLAEASGVTAPPVEAIEAIMGMVDVSDQPPFEAMERLGLKLISPTI